MTASRILFCLCLSFIGGIFFISFLPIDKIYLLFIGLVLVLIFIVISRDFKNLIIFGFCILFLVLGILRYQNFDAKVIRESAGFENKEAVVVEGIVTEEPEIKEKSIQLVVKISEDSSLKGKILVITRKYPQYQYGDRLKIVGQFQEPQAEGFNYKNYLLKDGIYSIIYFPKIEIVEKNLGNPIMKIVLSLKNKLRESLNALMSLPQAGLLEGLLFGDEENISKAWKEKFNLTGTRHITAVSGMNITIISFLVLNSLLALGLWRNQAFNFSIILISLYILMIGFPPSGVRAAIMAFLFLTAQHFGRLSSGSRAIVFAATIMLFLNPLLLKLDIGFQLSFLAMLGLIYLQSVFLNLFKKLPNCWQLRYNLASTLSAQIFTLPILIYNFGQIPLMAPLTNIFILPFLPAITILGFIFSFLGIIFQPLGYILSFPAWFVLTYILKMIDLFSKIPFASLALNVSWVWLFISYLALGLITWRLRERQKLKFLM